LATSKATPSENAAVDAQLLGPTFGWALTTSGVFTSQDSGATWARLPAPLRAEAVAARDADHILLGTIEGQEVVVAETSNRGLTWTTATLPAGGQPARVALAMGADLAVALVQDTTSANFSRATLFVERGASGWTKRDAPIAGGVVVDTSDRIWIAGGPGMDQAWSSDDLGQTWLQLKIPVPPPAAGASVSTPFSQPDGSALVGVTLSGPESTELFFTVGQGTNIARASGRVEQIGSSEAGVALPTAAIGAAGWVVASPASNRLYATTSGGASFDTTDGLPDGVYRLSFITPQVGWALTSNGTCAAGKVGCQLDRGLFGTVDGGQTWKRFVVPG
jgi:hypothetical protein